MAEGSEVNEMHIQNLANLCRICGNRLKKLKETYQTTYSCKDHREFLEKNFQINIEKDDPIIHPPRFLICATTLTRVSDFIGKSIPTRTVVRVEKKKRPRTEVGQKN